MTLLIALALVPLGVTAILLARYRFEGFIGMRYLGRSKPPARRLRMALAAAALLVAAGLVLLFAVEGASAVAAAVLCLLAGGFGALGAAMLLRFSLFTTVSALGLALGVAALMVVLGVTRGFERDFLTRVTSFHGHLVVSGYGEQSVAEFKADYPALAAKVRGLPGVIASAPFAISIAEVTIGGAGASLKALAPGLAQGPSPLAPFMVAGDLADLTRPAACGELGLPGEDEFVGRIVLGRPLAQRLRARVGDCVSVVIPFARAGELSPLAYRFRLIGLFDMGYHQHDTRLAYVSLDDLRVLEGARPFIYGVELQLADPLRAPAMVPGIEQMMGPGYRVLDWRFLSQSLFAGLETQRLVIGLFLSILILVSAFNLVASLIIVVITKRREIAVLAALGARPASLLRIFVVAGGIAGLVGTAAGLLMGGAISALLAAYDFPLDAAVYRISELPIDLGVRDVLPIAGIAQLAALLATLPPVLRARRLTVVEGLRQV